MCLLVISILIAVTRSDLVVEHVLCPLFEVTTHHYPIVVLTLKGANHFGYPNHRSIGLIETFQMADERKGGKCKDLS